MTNTFEWGDNIVNSSDIVDKYEDLQYEYDSLIEAVEDAETDEDSAKAKKELELFDKEELDILEDALNQLGNPTKRNSLTLIHEDHFEQYTKDTIDGAYNLNEFVDTNVWPWNCLKFDMEQAAEELQADYTSYEFDGNTYFVVV
jgi:hypothetical protein